MRRQNNWRQPTELFCRTCGEPFRGYNAHQKYCSAFCRRTNTDPAATQDDAVEGFLSSLNSPDVESG